MMQSLRSGVLDPPRILFNSNFKLNYRKEHKERKKQSRVVISAVKNLTACSMKTQPLSLCALCVLLWLTSVSGVRR